MCAEVYSIKLIFGETVRHQSPCSIFANEPHGSPHVVVERIQVWVVWWPGVLINEVWAVLGYYINALLPKLLEDCHDLMATTSYFSRMGHRHTQQG